jgi:hypothetical protein
MANVDTETIKCMLANLSIGARDLNKFFNIQCPIIAGGSWIPNARGALESRCTQTSDVITKLINGIDSSGNYIPVNTIMNDRRIDNATYPLMVSTMLGNFPSAGEILNIKISFPPGTEPINQRFPGHVSNILIQSTGPATFCGLVIQSFIYKYNMKIIYLSNNHYIQRYFDTLAALFLTRAPISVFLPTDEGLYNYVFGAEMQSYDGTSLRSRSKPNYINVSMFKVPNRNFLTSLRTISDKALEYRQNIKNDHYALVKIHELYRLLDYTGNPFVSYQTQKEVLMGFLTEVIRIVSHAEKATPTNCDRDNLVQLRNDPIRLTQSTVNLGQLPRISAEDIMNTMMKSPKRTLKKKNLKKSPKRTVKSPKRKVKSTKRKLKKNLKNSTKRES